jgi:hypothetical protein
MKRTVRYEVQHFGRYIGEIELTWQRESVAQKKTLRAARAELREFQKDSPPTDKFRIVRVTTTREVVK